MCCRLFTIICVGALALAGLGPNDAHAELLADLDAPVSAGSKLTWSTLVGKALRGVRVDAKSGERLTARELVLRRIEEEERTVVPEGSPVSSVEAVWARGDGKRYVVLLIGVKSDEIPVPGGGATLLAAFPEGSAEPQDVADVKEDVFCSFDEPATIALGPDDGVLVSSSHHNSSQGYQQSALYHVKGGRLRKVDSIFTLRARGACGSSFEEELTWKAQPEKGTPYPTVVASVTLTPTKAEPEEQCEGTENPIGPETFSAIYRFDDATGRYELAGGNMEKLERFNMDNL